jgi:hypothetical protein
MPDTKSTTDLIRAVDCSFSGGKLKFKNASGRTVTIEAVNIEFFHNVALKLLRAYINFTGLPTGFRR